MEDKRITVAVSGYFTILHKGHIRLFEEAKKLGDYLVVIVNNNQQQQAKKGRLIHKVEDIKYILEALRVVDKVVVSIDKDSTVCETLALIKPNIFANGGDRTSNNVPEDVICQKLGIKMCFGVGGDKHNSSSELIEKLGLLKLE